MKKATALTLLGGNTNRIGQRIGCTGAAIRKWPPELPARLVDRVIAQVVRDLVASNSGRSNSNRITLPPALYAHLCTHRTPLKATVSNSDSTPTEHARAGNYTKRQQITRRTRVVEGD